MGYEVLARKWRPRQFSDVIGQEHVTGTLRHAIESGRVAHAYLFVGPRGIGKTTLSRLFAKALDCAKGPTPDPCDECDLCREIAAGNALDVVEIDGASNNGVENIRDLRESIQFAPANARFKIFIIDEVHMLSTGAFNALLKTLEEPPAHAKFILATTEVDKLPATIISRCQRFDLRRIPTALIVDALRRIATSERVEAENDALLAIARGAEGGMRDALSALDQIISFKGSHVTEADVLAVFGLVARENLENLAAAILKGDMGGGLRIIDDLDRGGKDLRRLVMELLEHFRNLLVFQQLGANTDALDATPEQLAALAAQAGLADSSRVLRIAEHLADLDGRIRLALSRRTLLETTFVRCCRAATSVNIDQLVRQLDILREALPAAGAHDDAPPAGEDPPTAPPPATARPSAAAATATPVPAPVAKFAPAAAPATPATPATPGASGATATRHASADSAHGLAPAYPPSPSRDASGDVPAVHAEPTPAATPPAAPIPSVQPGIPAAAVPSVPPDDPRDNPAVQEALNLFDGKILRVEPAPS